MTLTPAQFETLCNLARKKAGAVVGWVAIAPARELTDLGLAARNRSGWQITAAGEAALDRRGKIRAVPAPPLPFPPRGHAATR